MLGLSRNPFRDATHDMPHVAQPGDRRLQAFTEAVLAGGRQGSLVIHGEPGVGRSRRLMLVADQAQAMAAFHAFQSLASLRPDGLVPRLASTVLSACRLGNLRGALSAPRWYRDLQPIAQRVSLRTDGRNDGAVLARALAANAPAALLIDDLDALPLTRAAEAFVRTLEDVRVMAGPHVLLAWTCRSANLDRLQARFRALHEGLHAIEVRPMANGEAVALVKGRLHQVRTLDHTDPLFPFTEGSIAHLNRAASGHPKRLLRLAEAALESCAVHGAYEIDAERVEAILTPSLLRDGRRFL